MASEPDPASEHISFERSEPSRRVNDEGRHRETSGSEYSESDGSGSTTSSIDFGDLSDDAEGAARQHQPRGARYSVLGFYRSFEDALSGRQETSPFVFSYVTRYESRRRHARVYECRSHVGCGYCVKITSIADADEDIRYELSHTGRHTTRNTLVARRGIDPRLLQEVDSLLSVGWCGGELRTLLQLRHANNEQILLIIPTARQLTNRKAYLVTHLPGGWVITNFAVFNAWASTKLCITRQRFEEVTDPADPRMDELFVLDIFHFPGDPQTFGAVVSSRRVFGNVRTSVEDQGDELTLSTDGTYKLDQNGWVLIAVGTVRTRWNRNSHVQEFITWFYVFVRSESSDAYRRAFEVGRNMARTFFDVELSVVYATLDHSEPIALALEETWPNVRLLSCWPHVARQARKKRSLLSDSELYDSIIKPHIDLLQAARSHAQFVRMAEIVTTGWIEIGERDYADWFRSVYLTRRWERWHINSADAPGVTPNQNPIEAHHRAVKRTCSPSSRASTTGVLTQILPRILKYDGDNLCPTSVAHVCPGPLIPEMLAKSKRLVLSTNNYRRLHRGKRRNRRVIAFLFNSSRFIAEAGNVIGSPLTEARARRFAASLDGRIAEGVTTQELRFEVLSMHCVSILGPTPIDPFPVAVAWEGETIQGVRDFVRCTCKGYMRSGWICSHVLATLSIYGLIDLDAALASVPVRRGPGRPPARAQALVTDDPRDRYFSVDRLLQVFTRRPGQPMQWRLLDDFDVRDQSNTETSNFVGTVIGFRLTDGTFIWTARFGENDYRDYDAGQLAQAVNRAHVAGVNVTG